MKLFVCKTWEIIVGQHKPSTSSGVRIWKLCLSEYRRPQGAICKALAAVFHFSISAPFNNLCLIKASLTESPLESSSKGWERCAVIEPLFTSSIKLSCLRVGDLTNGSVCFCDALFLCPLLCNTGNCLSQCLGMSGPSRSSQKQKFILWHPGTSLSLHNLPHLFQDSAALWWAAFSVHSPDWIDITDTSEYLCTWD